jgi:hypothetical protein
MQMVLNPEVIATQQAMLQRAEAGIKIIITSL